MQTLFLILLVIFSVGIGFFLGVLLLSTNSPLKDILNNDRQEPEIQEEEPPSSQPEESKPEPKDGPKEDSKLLLQIWQVNQETILYGYQGEYISKQDLPDSILALLKPIEEKPRKKPPSSDEDKEVDLPAQEVVPPEEVEEPEVKPLSLISEIDDILQEKLSDSPLSEKGIKLTENHKKEITIWVGLESYAAIDDVPDPEIQAIIKESVQDWENQKS